MEKLPLKMIKELQQEIIKKYSILSFGNFKISNPTQCEIFKILIESEMRKKTIYQKDLENLLNIRKSTISGILETMEKNRIIIRVLSNKGKIVKLSDEALQHKEVVANLLKKLEKELSEGISKEELEIFNKVIEKMKENLNKKGI